MAKKPAPNSWTDRKQPARKEGSNDADRGGAERRDRRTGEGSESALANLKNIERDRRRSTPKSEGDSGD